MFSMDATSVARQLLTAISAPRGSVTVFAEPDATAGFALRVWVRGPAPDGIPARFLGHPVRVERAPKVTAR